MAGVNRNKPTDYPGNNTNPLSIATRGLGQMLSMPDSDSIVASDNLATDPNPERVVSKTPRWTSCTNGTEVTSKQASHHLDRRHGTYDSVVEAHLEYVCHFANSWHQEMDPTRNYNTNYALGPPRPLFISTSTDFHDDLKLPEGPAGPDAQSHAFTPEFFWELRYLFIPISFALDEVRGHQCLVVISPEAKTLDFLDSSVNYGLQAGAPYGQWAACIEDIFLWMSTFLADVPDDVPRFVPREWKIRQDASPKQNPKRADCGMYLLTQAQGLAFGYESDTVFVPGRIELFYDHVQSMQMARRYRVTQDLLRGGFQFYTPPPGNNDQYYPVLDTPPRNDAEFGWQDCFLFPSIPDRLPQHVRRRQPWYNDCESKAALLRHCTRNKRYYPGYRKNENSGRNVTLQKFIEWAEKCDDDRINQGGTQTIRAQNSWPDTWVDPRTDFTRSGNGWPPSRLQEFSLRVW